MAIAENPYCVTTAVVHWDTRWVVYALTYLCVILKGFA